MDLVASPTHSNNPMIISFIIMLIITMMKDIAPPIAAPYSSIRVYAVHILALIGFLVKGLIAVYSAFYLKPGVVC